MTISSLVNLAVYRGNGATTSFPFPFYVQNETDLVIQKVDYVTGAVVSTYMPGEYSITGLGEAAGGQITISPALSDTYQVAIERIVPYNQLTDIVNQSGFYPQTIEDEFDHKEMEIQQLAALLSRAILVPKGETAIPFPAIAGRPGLFLAFDADGDLVPSSGTGADTALRTDLAASGGAALVALLQAGLGAVATSVQADLRARPINGVSQFGLNNAASGDVANVAKFQAWLLASAGRVGFLPAGTYNLDSATLSTTGLTIPAGTTFMGEGRNNTKIVVTGASACYLFKPEDVSRITVDDIWFYGNSTASSSGPGGAFAFHHSSGAGAHMTDITVRNCRFENFKGDSWVEFFFENTTYSLSRVRVENNVFISATGNARNGASTAVPSACVSFSAAATLAKAYDCRVTGNVAYCDYIKSFNLTWAGCNRFLIADNDVINAGTDASISNDSGAYAFMSYSGGFGNRPTTIRYHRNRVFGVRDCGLYATDIDGLEVDDFYCEGQTSTADSTLPKGIIALNATVKANISRVRAGGTNARGISLAGGASTDVWEFRDIDLGATCAVPWKYGSVAKTARIVIDGLRAHATAGPAMRIEVTATTGPERFDLLNFDLRGTVTAALEFAVTSGTPTFKHWRVGDGRIGDFGLKANGLPSTTSPLIIENVTFEDTWSSGSIPMQLQGSKNVALKNLHFVGDPDQYHLQSEATEGTIVGVTFNQVPTGNFVYSGGSAGLGLDKPTHAGTLGDFVQNLGEPTEAGSAGTKYVLKGWRFTTGTTWVAERTPTENNTATA